MIEDDEQNEIASEFLASMDGSLDYDWFLQLFHCLTHPFSLRDSRGNNLIHCIVKADRVDCLEVVAQHHDFNECVQDVNKNGQSVYHLAAIHCAQNVLEKLGHFNLVALNIRCQSNKTPLHYAAEYGHLGVVNELIFGLYEPYVGTLLNQEDAQGKLALHYAASQTNSVETLQVLLAIENRAVPLDHKHNTPLHLAAIYGCDRNISVILDAFPSWLEQKNSEGKTPYDVALDLRRGSTAKRLLSSLFVDNARKEYWRQVDVVNQTDEAISGEIALIHGETELGVQSLQVCLAAARKHQQCLLEAMILQKLGNLSVFDYDNTLLASCYPRIDFNLFRCSTSPTRFLEAYLLDQLDLAGQKNEVYLVALCLRALGNVCLSNGAYYKALMFYQSALSWQNQFCLVGQSVRPFQSPDTTLQREIAKAYQCYCGVKTPYGLLDFGRICHYQKQLAAARLATQSYTVDEADQCSQIMTQCYHEILRDLFFHYTEKTGDFLGRCSVIICGSVARGETSLYSDVEFFILTDSDEPAWIDKVESIMKRIEIDILLIGETPFPILQKGKVSIMPVGFCLDPHGIAPRGKLNLNTGEPLEPIHLIGTPRKLSDLISHRHFLENRERTVSLCSSDFLLGNRALYEDFQHNLQRQLDGDQSIFSKMFRFIKQPKLSLRAFIAQNCLHALTDEFKPRLDQVKESEKLFMVKQELYRIMERFVSSMALMTGCKDLDPWQRIDFFVKQSIISTQFADKLKESYRRILFQRFRVQRHYGSEFDGMWHAEQNNASYILPAQYDQNQIYFISQSDLNNILSIFQVTLALTKGVQTLCQLNFDRSVLKTLEIDSESHVKAHYLVKTFQYEEANVLLQESMALDPNNVDLMLLYAGSLISRGHSQDAINRLKRTELSLNVSANMIQYLQLLTTLGHAYKMFGQHDEALDCYLIGTQISKMHFPESVVRYSMLIGLVGAQLYTKKISEAKDTLSLASTLHSSISVPIPLQIEYLISQTHLAAIGEDFSAAITYCDEALGIAKSASTDDLKRKIITLNVDKASLLIQLGDREKGVVLLKEAYIDSVEMYTERHDQSYHILCNLASTLQNLGRFEEARAHYLQLLTLNDMIYHSGNTYRQLIYSALSEIEQALKNGSAALTYAQDAVQSVILCYGEQDRRVITRLQRVCDCAIDHDLPVFCRTVERIVVLCQSVWPEQAGLTLAQYGEEVGQRGHLNIALSYLQRALEYPLENELRDTLRNRIAFLYDHPNLHEEQGRDTENILPMDNIKMLVQQAEMAFDQKKYSQGINLYLRICDLIRRVKGDRDFELGAVYFKLALCYDATEAYSEAMVSAKKALDVLRYHLDPSDPNLVGLVTLISNLQIKIHMQSLGIRVPTNEDMENGEIENKCLVM